MANTLSFITLIIAITIHEFAHAFIADRLGDPTPRSDGRISLNPLKHLDPLGTIMVLFIGFGWGKPVQIDPYNFSRPKRDELLVALAGPASNLILAFLAFLISRIFGLNLMMIYIFIAVNVTIGIFNLLPVPPLDGSKVLLNILPLNLSLELEESFNQYGFILLALLLFLPVSGSNIISLIITPIISFILNYLT